MSGPLRIMVAGRIAGAAHHGGAAWAVLQYLLGFEDLGHEVHFVEPVGSEAQGPSASATGRTDVAYARRVLAGSGLTGGWSFLESDGDGPTRASSDELAMLAHRCDVLLNISGVVRDPEATKHIPVRVYVDVDPAFTQLWQAEGIDMGMPGHTHYVTVGAGIGRPWCTVPTGGVEWIASVPPVVLRWWPTSPAPSDGAITTVGNWRSYGSITFAGNHYGQRAHSFREIVGLPTLSDESFVVALAIDPAETGDLALLVENGWHLVDPLVAAGTPEAFASFVRASKAEIDVAKSGYVVSRSGWFSDRSACYLASGRPVVAQDTGFSEYLPTGSGLMPFSTVEEAADAVGRVSADYPRHARAARAIAEAHLDSRTVLQSLLERVGAEG